MAEQIERRVVEKLLTHSLSGMKWTIAVEYRVADDYCYVSARGPGLSIDEMRFGRHRSVYFILRSAWDYRSADSNVDSGTSIPFADLEVSDLPPCAPDYLWMLPGELINESTRWYVTLENTPPAQGYYIDLAGGYVGTCVPAKDSINRVPGNHDREHCGMITPSDASPPSKKENGPTDANYRHDEWGNPARSGVDSSGQPGSAIEDVTSPSAVARVAGVGISAPHSDVGFDDFSGDDLLADADGAVGYMRRGKREA